MSYDCFCDYDPADIYRQSIVTARKEHCCEECGGKILPKEKYEYTFGVWEGSADAFKTCIHCRDLRQWVKNNVPCLCWAHGNLMDDLSSAIEGAYDRARDEVRGLKFGFLRRVVARDKFNKSRRSAIAESRP